jgi:DNA ligase-1
MPDLAVGQTIEMEGSGSKPYIIKNCGPGGYSCTCPAWRNQRIDPRIRTCKHIRQLRGDAAEQERIGSTQELPSRKPEGEPKDAPPVLLAEKWDGETNVTGWWMSEKLDGVRAWWDGTRFKSRNGNLFLAPDWFVAGLPPVPLDGELWVTRKKFTLAQGIAMSQTRGDDWRQMKFLIFDAPTQDGEFEARLRFLTDLFSRTQHPFVNLLEQQQCRNLDHLVTELERVESLGGEGLMLRQPGSRYHAGRSGSLLKVKTFQTDEALVIGHRPGEGRHKGRCGALVARMANGKEFRIGTGLSDAERDNPPPIGSVVTYKYQELTEATGVPRFPVYVGLRRDASGPTTASAAPVITPSNKKATVTVPAAPPSAPAVKQGAVAAVAVAPAAPVAPVTAQLERLRRFECLEGTSGKFWEVQVTDNAIITRSGKIGNQGRMTRKRFAEAADAQKAAEKLIREKTSQGYVEK